MDPPWPSAGGCAGHTQANAGACKDQGGGYLLHDPFAHLASGVLLAQPTGKPAAPEPGWPSGQRQGLGLTFLDPRCLTELGSTCRRAERVGSNFQVLASYCIGLFGM